MALDNQKLKDVIENLEKINDLGSSTQQVFASIDSVIQNTAKRSKQFKDEIGEAKGAIGKAKDAAKELSGFTKEDLKDRNKMKKFLEKGNNLSKQRADIESKIRVLNSLKLNASAKEKKNLAKTVELLKDSLDYLSSMENEFQGISQANEEINKSTKWADSIAESLGSIPGIGPMISGPFKEASAAIRTSRAEGDNFFKSMGKGLNELVSTKAVIAGIVAIVFEADKKTTDLAKSLQISKDEAREIKENYTGIAIDSGKAYLNTNNLMEAQMQLTNELGMAVQFSDDQVKNQAFLTKQLGLSEKSAAKFTKYQISTGKSAKETNEEIADSVANLQKETGIAFKLNDVFEDVANANAGLKAAYGFNNKLLAEQVVQTKKIGINLEQAEKIASSMLDFESSIQAELEAELLTGKALNLEEARRLALMGKSTEAAAEILDQVGSTEDLMKMNVLQQEALAKAAGMERNELIASVKQREVQEKLGGKTLDQLREAGKTREEIAAITGEELLKQMEQESAAAKFEAAVIKIKDAIAAMVEGPVGSLLNSLAEALSSTEGIYAVTIALGSIMAANIAKSIIGFSTQIALRKRLTAQAKKEAATDVVGAGAEVAKSAAKLPIAGAVLAGIAAAGLIAYLMSQLNSVGDMASLASGKTIVSPKEGGLFELSKNDDLVAAPGAVAAMNKKPQTVVQDNSQLLSVMKEVLAVNKQIAAKSPVLEMAGDKVGNGVEQESREIQ